jgi:hypothetical protein
MTPRRIALLCLVLAVVGLTVAFWQPIIVHLSQETGTSDEASRGYAYWSGFGSVFPWSLAILGGIFGFYRAHECHNAKCHRPANHTTAKGHRLCKRCVGKSNSELVLHKIHEDHV